jgi:hypothetical protein
LYFSAASALYHAEIPGPWVLTAEGSDMKHKTRLAGVLAAIGLAAGMTLAGTGVARADVIPPSGWSEIYSPTLHGQGLTLCFDDPAGSTSSGTQVQLYHCHGYAANGAPQRWLFIQPEDTSGNPVYEKGHPVYEIYNVAAGGCLTASSLARGAAVVLGTCNQATTKGDMLWMLRSTGSSTFSLFPYPADFIHLVCVGASDLSGSNNTRLVMEACDNSNPGQSFSLG